MKMNDFIACIEKITSGRAGEIDLEGIDQSTFFLPDCLYLGRVNVVGEDADKLTEYFVEDLSREGLSEIISNIFPALADGVDQKLIINKDTYSLLPLMIIDALYGIMIQIESSNKGDLTHLETGSLSFWLEQGNGQSIVDYNLMLGEGLMGETEDVLLWSAYDNAGMYEIYTKTQETVPFFFLCPNVYVYEADGDDMARCLDPFVNFDLGYGSLLGWYRFESLVRAFGIDLRLDIKGEDREWLEIACKRSVRAFMWVYRAVEELMTHETRTLCQNLLELYINIYGVENEVEL